jgi:sugar phosphate isomerase/epimerase
MRVAGSTLLYSRLSLAAACDRLASLGFDCVDLGAVAGWAHLDPAAVREDRAAATARVEEACGDAGLDPVALNANAGELGTDAERRRVAALAALAEDVGADVLTLPAAGADTDLAADLARFADLAAATADYDVALTVETHWNTHTEDPAVAARYAAAVDGLGLTLDPGHFAIGPHWSGEEGPAVYEPLLDEVEHVHVRQAGEGWANVQRPLDADDGRIDVAALVAALRGADYDGALTVEYIDSLEGTDPTAAEAWAADARRTVADLLR